MLLLLGSALLPSCCSPREGEAVGAEPPVAGRPTPPVALLGGGALGPPPGLVFVRGGPTRIGTAVERVREFALSDVQGRLFRNTACETPEHTVEVEDFHLMVSEVTSEQYEAFVAATGHGPPQHWGLAALEEAQADFLREQGRLRLEARDRGQPIPERKGFDLQQWWKRNWEGCEWAIPEGLATHPVVYVDHEDARAYARWAGLRLMSEQEYQRACRGDSDRLWPWGAEWEAGRSANVETSGNRPLPVGSFPRGAVGGIHDLAGNVWEWTSSPYEPFPGFEDVAVTVGERELVSGVLWSARQQVVVSGCYLQSAIAQRSTTRRPTDPSQSTAALGFRCAAPAVIDPREIAREILAGLVLPGGVEYEPRATVHARRWLSEPGSAALSGYAIITDFDHLSLIPRAGLPRAEGLRGLLRLAREEGAVELGILSTSLRLTSPHLEPGTWRLVLTDRPARSGQARVALLDAEGSPVAELPCRVDEAAAAVSEPIEVMRNGLGWRARMAFGIPSGGRALRFELEVDW